MSENIVNNEKENFPATEDTKQKLDELQKRFDAAKESIDAIIAFLDNILMHEEEWLCDETNDD